MTRIEALVCSVWIVGVVRIVAVVVLNVEVCVRSLVERGPGKLDLGQDATG